MSETNPVTKFATGAIRDSQDGKPDFFETQSMLAWWRYAQYMTEKKKKYGEGNFKKGITKESYLKSAFRHLTKMMIIEDCKKYGWPVPEWAESREDHPCGLLFNTLGYMHEQEVEKLKVPVGEFSSANILQ